MSWSCNVASFRGMTGVPSARLELRTRGFDAAALASPASLCLRHPLATVLHVPEGGVSPNQLVCLDEGDSYLNFMCSGAGNFFFPVGASASTRTTLSSVAEMSLDAPACALNAADYIRASRPDGSALFFLPSDGAFAGLLTPAGATLITTRNRDGSVAHLYGTGQRELYYVYDTHGNNARETVKLADNTTILSQTITTDFGQVVAQAQPNTSGGFIYSRSEYNALGQLTKQYQDTGWNTAKTAATLYEYDAFGNVVKQTLALASSPTPQNSPVTELAYGAEALTDGIYRTVTRTRYNAEGNPLVSVQKSLASNLSDVLESKILTIDERNLTSAQWVEYHDGTKRKTYNALPTSDITAEAVSVDGFTLSQTVTTAYGSDGRVATAGFLHGGSEKQFSYEYMAGTHLLEKLTMPNNMSLTQSYEIQRDLLTGMAYHRGTTLVANRQYSYDSLGRPTARNTSRQGTANNLNQYTAIGDFTPTFDADGNQTLVKTSTGIWSITYDAENRPVNFTNAEANTVIECAYDHMGRRATKKVTVDGDIRLHQRYLYRGYLQIACCDLTRSNHPALWLITWDPTQPIATRPLAVQKDGTWYSAPARLASQDSRSQVCSRLGVWLLKSHPAYGWDLTKNICELYGSNGYIRTSYTYTPYGSVTESDNTWQPIQWSSEYNDIELGLVYYNYRHYNPIDGRWIGRDLIDLKDVYKYVNNSTISSIDLLGLSADYIVDTLDYEKVKCLALFFTDVSIHEDFFGYIEDKIYDVISSKTEKLLKKILKKMRIRLGVSVAVDQMVNELQLIPYVYVSALCVCKHGCKKRFVFLRRYKNGNSGIINARYFKSHVKVFKEMLKEYLSSDSLCD